jgi:DNA-binding NtrC family response regulator
VLQHLEFEPVGSAKTVRVDVRVVTATNKDLRKGMREGWLREDLFYRLNVIPIDLPPLRERREDIPLLVDHFLEAYNKRNNKSVTKLSRDVLDLLVAHDWPGNVRELENCIERAVVMSPGDVVSREFLPIEITERSRKAAVRGEEVASGEDEVRRAVETACATAEDLGPVLGRLTLAVEQAILRKAVQMSLSQRDLADKLGMSRMTLRKKLREYHIR